MGCSQSKPGDRTVEQVGLMEKSGTAKTMDLQPMQKKEKAVKTPDSNKPPKRTAKPTSPSSPPKKEAATVNEIPKTKELPKTKEPSQKGPFNRAKDRVEAIEATKTITIDGVTFRYAYLSQRGFYPDDPFKANQDTYLVHEHICPGRDDALFAVFDGHGQDGDGCAQYARDHIAGHLKSHIQAAIKSRGPEISRDLVHSSLLKAHVDTNKGLRKDKTIDDSLSGTTAIGLYFHNRQNRISISNVGDSRCIIAQEIKDPRKPPDAPGILKGFPLSRDQTPYRKDERARIRKTGARILSLDQLEGLEPIIDGELSNNDEELELGEELDEGGDPPRVWAPNGDYPGTAFTRSIGDAIAEELGVCAEPELLTREVLPQDRMIILASDGVYEFLTNQSVVDICAKFKDPLEACRAVVSEAHELWLQYELRTDDITMIALYIDEVKGHDPNRRSSLTGDMQPRAALKPSLSGESLGNVIMPEEGLRPVRKHVSKEASKEIEKLRANMKAQHAEEAVDLKKLMTKKTDEERAAILESIKASVMFRNASPEQKEMIIACMEPVPVKKGTWVIKQGSAGDKFYIIDEGTYEVRILPPGEEDETGEGGNAVHQYIGSREKNMHPSFGELALMYSAPRSASIIATSDGMLWALHRAAFRQVLIEAQDNRKELKKVLGKIPYFQYLDADGINKLAAIMSEITYGRGENITEQGRAGNFMFVIQQGTCYSVQMTSSETKRSNLKSGDFFGDELFIGDGKYCTTVMALQTTSCWQLDVDVLKQTMGPLLQGGSE